MHKATKKNKARPQEVTSLMMTRVTLWPLFASILATALFYLPGAHAQELSVTALKLAKPGQIKGTLDLNYDAFPDSDKPYFGAKEKTSGLTTIGASVVGQSNDNFVDGSWFYSSQEDFHYFDVREASHDFHRENYNIWFGRHLEEWSQADSFWRMGYWQPQFNWDKLRPDENGLTGVFVQSDLDNSVKVSVFVTPIYLPSMGANFREQNDQIVSNNPWFKTPPPVVDLFKRATDVHVSIDSPSVPDTVFKPSIALRSEIHAENDTWLRGSYAYKPMNSPILGYSYYLTALASSTLMQATVEPQFIYHHIATIESQMKTGDVAIIPSVTYDAPQVKDTPAQWIAQDMAPSVLASLTLNWHPDGSRRDVIYGGVMYDWTDFPPDRGENAQSASQFELRPTWLSAIRMGFDHSQEKAQGRELGYGVEGTVDPRQNGGVLLSQVRYRWSRELQTRARADILGVFSDASNPYSTGFIQTYHANSTVGLDVSYVY